MIFNAIKAFVNDLGDAFAKDSHPLALYERLINKTTEEHKEAVQKHITAFTTFCMDNIENIKSQTATFSGQITYSPRVFIDMNEIFKNELDTSTSKAIWSHLLTISALVDPSCGALQVLKSANSIPSKKDGAVPKIQGEGDEGDFLNDIISRVEEHVNGDVSDPSEAISSIMSSGLIPNLVGSLNDGISSGKLDLSKMMMSVQKMVGSLSSEMGSNGEGGGMPDMLSNMMGMMSSMTQQPK
jgi:hypothetical protein